MTNYREAFGERAELPIAFWYSDKQENETEKISGCFFKGLQQVREGKTISLNSDVIGCGGGKFYTGFTEMPIHVPNFVSLKEKYNNMIANKPKERKAMLIANANIKAKIQEQGLDPNISEDKKVIKKISSVEMQRARDSVGASGRKSKVTFTDREWEAVQAGAISDNMLTKFLNSSDSDEIVKRAMPKATATLSSAKLAKAKAMLNLGASYDEVAKACGVPKSTIYSALDK